MPTSVGMFVWLLTPVATVCVLEVLQQFLLPFLFLQLSDYICQQLEDAGALAAYGYEAKPSVKSWES